MAKRKLTPNQVAAQKEIARIKRFIRRAEKRGFIFEPIDLSLPARITKKKIEQLKAIKPNYLYNRSKYYDALKGKYIKGTERRTQERKKAAKKAANTRFLKKSNDTTIPWDGEWEVERVISNIRIQLNSFAPLPNWSKYWTMVKTRDRDQASRELDQAIADLGEEQVARNIQGKGKQISAILDEITYDSDRNAVSFNLVAFIQILRDVKFTLDESVEYTERMESGELWE